MTNMLRDYMKETQGYEYAEIPNEACCLYRVIDKECHIGHMYVAPEARKKGLSFKMGDRMATLAKELGCTDLSCVISINPDSEFEHTRRIKMCAEFGYTIAGIIGGNQVVMRKKL